MNSALVGSLHGLKRAETLLEAREERLADDLAELRAMSRKYTDVDFSLLLSHLDASVAPALRRELDDVRTQLDDARRNVQRGKILLQSLDNARDDAMLLMGGGEQPTRAEALASMSAAAASLDASPRKIYTSSPILRHSARCRIPR